MPRRRQRIYWRERGGEQRAYGDFRDYSDVGGGREALKPKGAKVATTDPRLAERLANQRLEDLEKRRLNKNIHGIELAALGAFAAHHLVQKKRAGRIGDAWLGAIEKHLRAAVEYFGEDRELHTIDAPAVGKFVQWLARQPSGHGQNCPECGARGVSAQDPRDPLRWTCEACRDRGRVVFYDVPGLTPSTQRKNINSLSNLYRRAQSEGCVMPGHNPVAALLDKPIPASSEARWLEVPDAALLLESARTYSPQRDDVAIDCLYPLLATFLLTGGRKAEVLGLAIDDISFDRRTVTFRPHKWRGLKTRSSRRVVPLWPQLEEVLRPYVFGGSGPPGRLLFPSSRTEEEQPIREIRRALDAIAQRAGWEAGEIRSKMFRHTYCAARLQTLDTGAPVSPWTVAREMGHGGRAMVDRVYGHLGDVRHRAEVVEFRVEQHRQKLGERLAALAAG